MSIDINLDDTIEVADAAGVRLPTDTGVVKAVVEGTVRIGGAAAAIVLAKGATSPRLEARLVDENGSTVSLVGATVRVRARTIATGRLFFDRPAVLDGATILFDWLPSDTARPAAHCLSIQVLWGDFTIELFPSSTLRLVVEGDVPLPY